MSEMLPSTNSRTQKKFYFKAWGFKGNASAGISLSTATDKVDWDRCARWKTVGDAVSFSLYLWRLSFLFRFYHPGDWRCNIVLLPGS